MGTRFIVDLESGKPTARLEHVLRVIDALGVSCNWMVWRKPHLKTRQTEHALAHMDELQLQPRQR